jgi:hypothetical protein
LIFYTATGASALTEQTDIVFIPPLVFLVNLHPFGAKKQKIPLNFSITTREYTGEILMYAYKHTKEDECQSKG